MPDYAIGFERGRDDARKGNVQRYTSHFGYGYVNPEYVRGYIAGYEDEVWFSALKAGWKSF